jgi:hypothetical protein
MKKLLQTLLKGSDTFLILIAYLGILFVLAFGFDMLYTIWKALID